MTERDAAGQGDPQEPVTPGTRRRRAGAGALAAAAFIAGLVAGAITLALLMESPPANVAEGPSDAVATPGSTPDPDSGAEAGVRVNDDCLRALNGAQDAVSAIEDIGRAAADLDLARLNEVIRRLQPVQDRLRTSLEECRVDGELPEDLSPSEAPGEEPDPEGD